MTSWKTIHISDLGRIVTGKTPKTSVKANYGGDIPFLTPSDDLTGKYAPKTNKSITKVGLSEVKNCLLQANAICVSCIGSDLGKVVKTTKPLVTNQQINSIIPYEDYDADFIYYLMLIVGGQLNYLSKTSTAVPIINKTQFSNFEVKVPPLEAQRRIAGILGAIDDKIENNRRINTNLELQAQALYKQWFVDNHNEDWERKPLSEIAEFIGGYSYKGNELIEASSTAMATIKNFERKGGFKVEGFKDIVASPKLKAEQHTELFDILVAHTDLTQNADVIGNAEILLTFGGYTDVIFSMDLVKVLPKSNFPYKYLLAALLKNPYFKAHCLGYVNGTTVLHMSKKALPEYVVACPPNSEAEKMDRAFKVYYHKMAEILQENETLATIRDTLLPKLMNGEIKL